MKPIIKILLIRHSKEQGFVIPLIIALGLIMTLIGTINIVKSKEENITAISQRGTHVALAAAEAGVAYYRDLIDKNKTIAVYDACNDIVSGEQKLTWDSSNSEWDCTDSGAGDESWANAATIPGIGINCDYTDTDGNDLQGATAVQNATVGIGWQDVNGNSDLGQYRLRSYDYDDVNDTGTLQIEGRDRNSNDAAAIQVNVTFPIQRNSPDNEITANLNNLDPVVWIGSETITLNGDNLNVQGNILVTKDDCDLSSTTQTIANTLGNVVADPRALPATLSPPDTFGAANDSVFYDSADTITASDPNPDSNTNLIVIKDDAEIINQTLPRSQDSNSEVVGKENIYHYLIEDQLNLSDGNWIKITPGAKVILYVQGNIIINGEVDINCDDTDDNETCDDTNTSDRLEIYGNSNNSGSNQFGCNTTGGITCPTETITVSGATSANEAINIKGFLHAPDATLTISDNSTINITGAVWVEAWSDTSNTKNVNITPDDRYKEYERLSDLTGTLGVINPIVLPTSSWQTQEVTDP